MLCKLNSLGLHGVTGYLVAAECDLSGGLPNFDIVGLPDAAGAGGPGAGARGGEKLRVYLSGLPHHR